jgi:hypothetical protein
MHDRLVLPLQRHRQLLHDGLGHLRSKWLFGVGRVRVDEGHGSTVVHGCKRSRSSGAGSRIRAVERYKEHAPSRGRCWF